MARAGDDGGPAGAAPAGEDGGEDGPVVAPPPAGGGQPPLRRAVWAGLLTGAALIVALLFFGSGADYLVAVLALLLTFVFGYLTVFPLPWGPVAVPPAPRVALVAGVVVLGLLVGSGAYFALYEPEAVVAGPPIRIENPRDLGPGSNLGPGAPATLVFTGPTPDRRYLGLELSIRQNVPSGDCLNPARATLVPRRGGTQGAPIPVEALGGTGQDPSRTTLELEGSVSDLRIDVLLDTDPGCRVELTVTEARFYGVL